MSERRNLERMTKTGRGVIHTRPASDEYRDGWERTFGKRVLRTISGDVDLRRFDGCRSCGKSAYKCSCDP